MAKRDCDEQSCKNEGTEMIARRGQKGISYYCKEHIEIYRDKEWRQAEYIVDCPKCGCAFGVN